MLLDAHTVEHIMKEWGDTDTSLVCLNKYNSFFMAINPSELHFQSYNVAIDHTSYDSAECVLRQQWIPI